MGISLTARVTETIGFLLNKDISNFDLNIHQRNDAVLRCIKVLKGGGMFLNNKLRHLEFGTAYTFDTLGQKN